MIATEVTDQEIMEEYAEEIGEAFCGTCPRISRIPGNTDSTGVQITPDTIVCPAGCDHPSEDGCERRSEYRELAELARQFAARLRDIGEGK